MLDLSDEMQQRRHEYSQANPTISADQYHYGAMRRDAELQFAAAADGRINSRDATTVPATSAPAFFNTLRTTPPASGQSRLDALASVGIGAATQMRYGDAPGSLFDDTGDTLPQSMKG